MNNQFTTIATMLVLAGGLFITSCGEDQARETRQAETIKAATGVAEMRTVPSSHHFTGTVQGERRINLSTKVMGRIAELSHDIGDPVSEGEVLVRISNENILAQRGQIKANLAEAQAALENTEINYRRIKALYEDKSATQKELDDITMQLNAARARVQALESKLVEIRDMIDYSVINSPINGYVVNKRVQQGDMANPGQPLLTVEEVDNLVVYASVPAAQIGLFATGDTLSVRVGATEQTISGVVDSINPSADPRSRQYEVKISLAKQARENGTVKPGMFADITLQKGRESMIVVPKVALVKRGQLTGIYTLNGDNEVMLRWVNTGRSLGDDIEILSGIAAGESFVVAGDDRLREGQKVSVQLSDRR